MTPSSSPALGLSIGTTTLAAVTADRAVTGRPVVNRCGFPIADFVHRVGDPVGIVALDGSVHTGAALLADALYELARSVMSGRPVSPSVAVSYPANWRPAAVEALGRELRRIPAWSAGVRLIPDYAAALTVLRESPGLPTRGVIVVCDFGAAATTLTSVDADGMTLIGEPVRYPDFGGDLIDRSLLAQVLTVAGVTPGATGTTAIGALTRLRDECREAKERLSTQTVATVAGAPAGARSDIRITRAELDDVTRGPLTGVVTAVADMLQRNDIAPAEVVAVASVGGMAAVPVVTTTLSEQLRVPIITVHEPALAAARGAMVRAAGDGGDEAATVLTGAAVQPESGRPEPEQPARAWSNAADIPDVVPQLSSRKAGRPQLRPRLDFVGEPASAGPDRPPWHRKPLTLAAAVLAVVAGAGVATAVALRADTSATPALPGPSVSTPPASAPAGPVGAESALRTVVAVPGPGAEVTQLPPVTETVMAAPAPEASAPAPAALAPEAPVLAPVPVADDSAPVAPAPARAAEPEPVTEVATVASVPVAAPQIPAIPAIPEIPAIPQIPIPSIDLSTLFPQPPSSG